MSHPVAVSAAGILQSLVAAVSRPCHCVEELVTELESEMGYGAVCLWPDRGPGLRTLSASRLSAESRSTVLARAIEANSIDPSMLAVEIDVLVLSRQRQTDPSEQHQSRVRAEAENPKWQIWQRKLNSRHRRTAL
jgi:hypothetical protein